MILFKLQHQSLILSGSKTTTRRLGKKRWNEGAIHQCKINYSTQPFARIRIIRVYQQPLGKMTNNDARREGFQSLKKFKQVWMKIYKRWLPHLTVWVIDFKKI